jgi:hypothetical protein
MTGQYSKHNKHHRSDTTASAQTKGPPRRPQGFAFAKAANRVEAEVGNLARADPEANAGRDRHTGLGREALGHA